MPEFPIVDSHVHFYDVDRLQYRWLQSVPSLNQNTLPAEFDAARGPVEVDRMVFAEVDVDAGQHLQEAAFVQELADADPRLAGMIAHAPVERGDAVQADLEALAAFPSLRGIRRLIQSEPDPSFCLEPKFIEGVQLVGRQGLTFDICVKHWALTFAIELARRCQDVQFVLDHIGKPGIRQGLREPWWGQMRELARMPNVVCKISGAITEADHATWTREQVIPYVAHAIECFGFDRVMFAGDWPVSALASSYPDWVALLDQILAGTGEETQRQLYRDTAIRIYRL